MSELAIKKNNSANLRRQLLASVSAIVLVGGTGEIDAVQAADEANSHPTVWIELGGELSRLDQSQDEFSPLVMEARPSTFSASGPLERPSLYSFGETGKISIEPEGTDWVLSVSARYGRSSDHKTLHQQTHPADFIITKYGEPLSSFPPQPPIAARFADTNTRNSESHLVLDFQVGKDVGLGIFGRHGSATLSAGVRFAQFNSRSNISLKSDPDWHFSTKYIAGARVAPYQPYHSNIANLNASRSFHGLGPTLSWNGVAPIAGHPDTSELTFDWGVNAAILFGRQKALVHHQTTSLYHSKHAYGPYRTAVPTPVNTTHSRAHNVVVPNLGGFAGASWRVENFKASFGYRADFFFGAMDGGIDGRKSEDVGFHGPFATISMGLGG